jgi:hypothetical protein
VIDYYRARFLMFRTRWLPHRAWVWLPDDERTFEQVMEDKPRWVAPRRGPLRIFFD